MLKIKKDYKKLYLVLLLFLLSLIYSSILFGAKASALSSGLDRISINSYNTLNVFSQAPPSPTPTIPGAPSEEDTKNFDVKDISDNPIVKWLNVIVNVLAGVVGVGAVLMVIWGGIQYITARDNAQAVQSAKEKIINVVIGLAVFIFLYALLQWLIPGGAFS